MSSEHSSSEFPESGGAPESEAIRLSAALEQRFSYACWQNNIPLFKSLKVNNSTTQPTSELTIDLRASPEFLLPRQWQIGTLEPSQCCSVADCNPAINGHFFESLNEAQTCTVTLRLQDNDRTLATWHQDVRLLARDEWTGGNTAPETLAAFVRPNGPGISELLNQASRRLSAGGQENSLEGYQSGNPHRAWLQVAAIWSALASHRLTYVNPPGSFERTGQKIRSVADVLQYRQACCLDLSVLLASACEAAGLNTTVILQDSHCLIGVWMVDRAFASLLEHEPAEIRKAATANELLLLETTLLTGESPSSLTQAREAAVAALQLQHDARFFCAVDLRRARMARILPMASSIEPGFDDSPDPAVPEEFDLPLPPPPFADQLPSEYASDQPRSAAQRLDRWQRKLLDLTLRNQLLNFRPGRSSVPFLCPPLSRLEDRLASGRRVTLVSLSDHIPAATQDHEESLSAAATNPHFMADAVGRGELPADLSPEELTRRLTVLYRRSRNDLAEGGSNTLFLAIGFLRWKQSTTDQRSFVAPLLLLPVSLVRRNARSAFQLVSHEDDVRVNSTLLQMLRQDFSADLQYLESDLPRDDEGIDVQRLLQQIRADVRELPGFEVLEDAALSTFSFAKYLMWKDLMDRSELLRENRVVRHLADNPEMAFLSGGTGSLPRPHTLDQLYSPDQLVFPLPADSSQLAAIAAASEGQDFVIIGPPGTGKSQTIANMIAHCLSHQKTVLFVAEKTAALDVVYRRLCQQGLSELCIELHSSRADRRRFLEQMRNAWESASRSQDGHWQSVCGRLHLKREELNRYVNELHQARSCGLSLFEAMGFSVLHADKELPQLNWPDSTELNAEQLEQMRGLMQDLAVAAPAARSPRIPQFLCHDEWTPEWESRLLESSVKTAKAAQTFSTALQQLATSTALPVIGTVFRSEFDPFCQLLKDLQQRQPQQIAFLLETDADRQIRVLRSCREQALEIKAFQQRLSTNYPPTNLLRLPAQQLEAEYRAATAAFWPLSVFRQWQTARKLRTWTDGSPAQPQQDLPLLLKISTLIRRVGDSGILKLTPFQDTWLESADDFVAWIDETVALHKSLSGFGSRLRGACRSLAETMYHGTVPSLGDALQSTIDSAAILNRLLSAWEGLLGGSPVSSESAALHDQVIDAAETITRHRDQLRDWTAWNAVSQPAARLGLAPLSDALLNGDLTADEAVSGFDLAWIRWWLPKEISRNALLCSFRGFTHEEAVSEFRRLDDAVRKAAVPHILSAGRKKIPQISEVPRRSELGLLRHQMQLQRPSKSIRTVIESMPEYFTQLAPCLLMSPLSVSQYLPADHTGFDVVILDEASQITTWDAIGAIARGKQTIVVGDPKQLPPTNFFGRNESDEESHELDYFEQDLESILDEAQAAGLPAIQLSWHYRSRHESLIAFSNRHYYENQLLTFPSAVTADSAVALNFVEDGVFDRGKSRTNRREAEAVSQYCTERLLAMLLLPEPQRLSIGVITFNVQQQTLIEDLMDAARRSHPEIEWFFDEAREEPFVVKNLENVQGDERDCILFSITYGPDSSARLTRNFGPLNRQGGQRRLNVAVTRARRELRVFSSFKAEQLSTDGIRHIGVSHLKNFLDYAERGVAALPESIVSESDMIESSLETAVARALEERGWILRRSVGVSRFRIGIGVVHPHDHKRFLAGIECDGTVYRDAAAARDRDRIRGEVLHGLGWQVLRIWSPDWWYSPEQEANRLHEELTGLLAANSGSPTNDASAETDVPRKTANS